MAKANTTSTSEKSEVYPTKGPAGEAKSEESKGKGPGKYRLLHGRHAVGSLKQGTREVYAAIRNPKTGNFDEQPTIVSDFDLTKLNGPPPCQPKFVRVE